MSNNHHHSTNPTHDTEIAEAPPLQEGVRATAFRTIFQRALDHSLNACSYNNFAQCFPTPAKEAPKLLNDVWGQVCGYWRDNSMNEFEAILRERNVVQNLNELDRLIDEAKARKAANPDTDPISPADLAPPAIASAHLTPLFRDAQPRLREDIKKVQHENKKMIREIEEQRREVERLVRKLQEGVEGLEGLEEEARACVEGDEVVGEMDRLMRE